jgi:hypothetical protein
MIFFAYDGTANGDWVWRYVLRLAAHHPSGQLCVVHIDEGRFPRMELAHRIESFHAECDRLSVKLKVEICPVRRGVFATLASLIPSGPDVFLICGTRAKERGGGILAGTVGQEFLRMGGRQVLALRVVEPGLLGIPRRLLIPLAGRPSGFRPGLPFLKLLAPDITQIHLLHVKQVRPVQLRRLTHEQSVSLRRAGVGLCMEAEREIIGALGHSKVMIDAHIVISDDVAKEIIIHAGKCKSRLIYMGASERSLAGQLILGSPLERVLRDAPCDVGVYRGLS